MTGSKEDLLKYRINRAKDTLDDALIFSILKKTRFYPI
jgi:hypothetical protein